MSARPEYPAPTGYTSWVTDAKATADKGAPATIPILWSCNQCGSVVADTVKHNQWHNGGAW